MKKMVIALFVMILTPALFAASNPTVTLQSSSLGYLYSQPFTVNVSFTEPVVGFGVSDVNIINGTITRVTGGCPPNNFELSVQPTTSGPIRMVIPANSVVSQETGLPNLVSNTLNLIGLNPTLKPSSNFDLRQWSLTLPLPLGYKENAISIGPTTLNGTPGQNNGYINPPYFYTDPATGAMNFSVPLNGATTPGSNYSRSELYEILPTATPTWKLSTYTNNTMTASVSISHVPPIEKRFVIGQIHDKGDTDPFGHTASNSPLLKLYYDTNTLDPNNNPCNGCVYAQIRTTPSQSNYLKIVNLIKNIPFNTVFIYQITLLRNGTLTIKANNASTTTNLNTSTNNTIGWGSQNLYFKAGAYNLEHDSVTGGADSFYSLQVSHT